MLHTSISLAAQRRKMKLKMIINFKKGQIPMKLRIKHFLLSAVKTMGGVT